jgi:hypothetical protein
MFPPGPTLSSEPNGSGDSAANILLPLIGGVVGGIALLLAVTVIIMVIFFIVIAKRGLSHQYSGSNDERTYDLPANYEKPIAPPVETIPPRISMEMNVAYEQVKSFDMNDNSAYTNVARI